MVIHMMHMIISVMQLQIVTLIFTKNIPAYINKRSMLNQFEGDLQITIFKGERK